MEYKPKSATQAPSWWQDPIQVVISYGQSRSHNYAEGTVGLVSSLTTTSPYPDRVLMLNNARRPGLVVGKDYGQSVTATSLVSFVDRLDTPGTGQSQLGQSLGSGLWLLNELDISRGRSTKKRIYVTVGEGGTEIEQLGKTKLDGITAADNIVSTETYQVYARLLRVVTAIKTFARVQFNRPIEVIAVYWLQGEADVTLNTTKANYKTMLAKLISDLRTDVPAITGQSSTFAFISDITHASFDVDDNNPTPVGKGNPGGLGVIETALANADGNTYMAGPIYYYPFYGPLHMCNEAVILHGERFARTLDTILAGGTPSHLRATGFSREGRVITINCSVPTGPLTIDTHVVPAATGTVTPTGTGVPRYFVLGFEFVDSIGTKVESVSTGYNTIQVTLNQVPSGTMTLRYAYNGLGNTNYTHPEIRRSDIQTHPSWGNIRDSYVQASRFVTGFNMHNFLLPFEQAIT